ncbi:MAG: hypothetical protein U5K37_06030 [Natrialbaceae archaeon]|nr:hypothetical protein [Natrialbaceae archaeon]
MTHGRGNGSRITASLVVVTTILLTVGLVAMSGSAAGFWWHEPPSDGDGEATFETATAEVVADAWITGDAGIVMFTYETDKGELVRFSVEDADGKKRTVKRYSFGFERISFVYPGLFKGGEYPLEVTASTGDETLTGTIEGPDDVVDLTDTEPEPAFFDVGISGEDVTEGEVLTVEGSVENTGDESDTQNVTVSVADQSVTESVTLAPGESDTVTLDWQTETSDAETYDATIESDNDTATTSVTVEEPPEPAFFDVSITGTNSPVEAGDTLTVDADVTNTGDQSDTQDITLAVDGDVDSEAVSLAGGDSTSVTLEWNTDQTDVGSQTATVSSDNDSDSTNVTVEEPPEPAFFDVTITGTNSPVQEGQTLTVDADVSNTGETASTQDIALSIDGSPVDSQSVSLGRATRTSVSLEWMTGSGDAGNSTATVSSDNDSDSAAVTVEEPPESAFFDVEITGTNSPVEEGQTLTVDADVTNTGGLADTQDVALSIDGSPVDSQSVSLNAGDSSSITLEWMTSTGDAGNSTATVSSENDSDSTAVTVEEPPEPAFFDVAITGTNSPVQEGQTLTVDADVTNTGDLSDTQDINLAVNGDVDTQSVNLAGGDSTSVTLEFATSSGDAGNYTATVSSENDSDSTAVTVEEPPEQAFFDVAITGTNTPVEEGDTLSVDADVTNTGDLAGTQDITLAVDGAVDSQSVNLAGGASTSVTLEWDTANGDAGNYTATVSSDNDSDSTAVSVEEPPEPAFFDVAITGTNSPVEEGDTLTVDADVSNTGDLSDTQDVTLAVNGDVDSQSVSLAGGDSTSVTLEFATSSGDAGNYTATVSSENDSDSTAVTVEEPPEPAFFDVAITGTNSSVEEGETLTVDADVTNTGELADTQDITLAVDGAVDSQSITLAGGASTSVTLEWATSSGDAGNYTATVSSENDSDSVAVSVDEPAPVGPTGFDAYVKGERGYLHTGLDKDPLPSPIDFSRCEDFNVTQDYLNDSPDYLPTPECITASGTIDHANNTWEGDIDFPTTYMEQTDDLAGDVYVEASITSNESGAWGTWNHDTGEVSLNTNVSISVNIYQVSHGTPWENVTESDRITDDTCHIPNVELSASSEKSYTTNSTFPNTTTVTGERLAGGEAYLVSNDFPVAGAQDCGSLGGFVDLNPIINDELGVPAPAGANEVAFDVEFAFQQP